MEKEHKFAAHLKKEYANSIYLVAEEFKRAGCNVYAIIELLAIIGVEGESQEYLENLNITGVAYFDRDEEIVLH